MRSFAKALSGAPAGYPAWEAAGLSWLNAAHLRGGARAAQVIEVADDHLTLEHLDAAPATAAHAEDFGRALAATHDAGAPAFGAPPPDWPLDHGWLGPAQEPLVLPTRPTPTWGAFFAEQRIRHTIHLGRRRGLWPSPGDATGFEAVARRVAAGEFDDDEPPARLHGDLWSGNLRWTAQGVVLIDPAAHGGHRESDLAMLALFGAPHLDRIIAAYDEAHPLTAGWRERAGLHQLHPVLLHAVLFGGGYDQQARTLAAQYA